jgi:large subunit ribosomal protein L4
MAQAKKKTTTKAKVAKKATEVKLNPSVWSLPYNADLVAQVVYVQRSNARLGTAAAKTRAEVAGGGRKPWAQKGTGRARAGSIRSPLWAKGGVVFTPTGRNWKRKVNRKMAKKAVCVMLSERLRKESLDFVNMPAGSELKKIRESVASAVANTKSTLVVSADEKVSMALSNIPTIEVVTPANLNAYTLVKSKKILIENGAVNMIETQFGNGK